MKQSAGGRAVQVLIALGKSVCYLALFLGAGFSGTMSCRN